MDNELAPTLRRSGLADSLSYGGQAAGPYRIAGCLPFKLTANFPLKLPVKSGIFP